MAFKRRFRFVRLLVAAIAAALTLVAPINAYAQNGLSLRGWVRGLPQTGITLPRTTAIAATVDVLVERGTSVLSVPIVFPANSGNIRTADATAEVFQTRILNGQLLELHVLEEGGRLVVRVIRDVPSLRVTGVVTAMWDATGLPIAGLTNFTSDCQDPRSCITVGQPGRLAVDLGAASGHVSITLDMNLGTVFSTIVVGCQYSAEVVVVGGRLFAGRIEGVGPRGGDFCTLTPPSGAHGLTLRGWMAGLPGGSVPLPPAAAVNGYSIVPSDRGTSFSAVPIRFPAELAAVRTADATAGDEELVAQIRNGLALDLHLIPDGSATNAWVVRDVAVLRLTGVVKDIRDQFDRQVAGLSAFGPDCEDPRVCVPTAIPGSVTLDIGISTEQLAMIDVGLSSLIFQGICLNARVAVEAVVTGGQLFAVRVEGNSCLAPPGP